jgi:two-component system chemotaxis response regulator CheY
VLEAGDCATALHLYAMHAPDATFLDIELPDANGYTVLKQCVAADKAAFIVMLSANSVKEHILASLEEGAQGFVTKPFTKEKLIHYLNMCETARKIHLKSTKS